MHVFKFRKFGEPMIHGDCMLHITLHRIIFEKTRCLSLVRAMAFLAFITIFGSCEKNHPPVISGITCAPQARSAGTLFTLAAKASDEDGDALQYLWSADGGLFTDSVNQKQTAWKSPVDGNGKTFTIKVTVSDGKLESTLEYPIQLSEPVFGVVSGFAYFSNCTVPVSGAEISVDDQSTVTDSSGYFFLRDIPVGSYALKAIKPNFSEVNLAISILQFVTLKVTIPMISVLNTSKVSGIVTTQDSLPIGGATVTMLNPDQTESKLTTTTNAAGFYRLWYVPDGQRKIIARKAQTEEFGFEEVNLSLAVTGPEYPLNIEMRHYNLLGIFTDLRDNHQYGFKILGSQTWMTENLAYLPRVSPSKDGTDYDSYYYVYAYEGSSPKDARSGTDYTTFGALYNWTAAQEACPQGWHLPSDVEWKIFENYLGPDAGFRLKSIFGWTNHGNGNNSSGFNVLPAGERQQNIGFEGLGNLAQFWSTTIILGHGAWTRMLRYDDNVVYRFANSLNSGLSVRCLKD